LHCTRLATRTPRMSIDRSASQTSIHPNANTIAKATDWMPGVSLTAHSVPRELVGNRLSQERLNRGNIFFEVGGKPMALLEIIGRIIAKPHFAIRVFPDEWLER